MSAIFLLEMVKDYDTWAKFAILHCFVGVFGGFLIGFVPEGELGHFEYGTGLEPFAPAIAVTAFLLGYFACVHIGKGQSATSAWVPGLAWMLLGFWATASNWDAHYSAEKNRLAYVLANLFTSKCEESECLAAALFTMPFTASIAYSIGAYIRSRRGVGYTTLKS